VLPGAARRAGVASAAARLGVEGAGAARHAGLAGLDSGQPRRRLFV